MHPPAVDWTLVLTCLITTLGAVVTAFLTRRAGQAATVAKHAAVRSVDAANSLRPPTLPEIPGMTAEDLEALEPALRNHTTPPEGFKSSSSLKTSAVTPPQSKTSEKKD